MAKVRPQIKISPEDNKRLLEMKRNDVSRDLFIEFFAATSKGEAKYQPNDLMDVPKGHLNIEKDSQVRVGRYLFNKFILGEELTAKVGFLDKTMNKGAVGSLEDYMIELMLDGELDARLYVDYINRISWLAFTMNDFLCPSVSYDVIAPLDKVEKRKKELFKQYEKEIAKGDLAVGTRIEKELVDLATEELKDSPSMDMFNSKASKATMGNHYKNTSIMRGAMVDSATGAGYISQSNYVDGIRKEDYAMFGDSIVSAVYPKAIGTQRGGYETKRFFAAFQAVSLAPEGSDCGTKKTLKVLLTEANYKLFQYRYIVDGGKLVQLNGETKSKYLNKYINIRTPQFCTSEQICSKCAGDLYYKLGIKNMGLTVTKISSTILNAGLKKMHDSSIKVLKMDYKNYIK